MCTYICSLLLRLGVRARSLGAPLGGVALPQSAQPRTALQDGSGPLSSSAAYWREFPVQREISLRNSRTSTPHPEPPWDPRGSAGDALVCGQRGEGLRYEESLRGGGAGRVGLGEVVGE